MTEPSDFPVDRYRVSRRTFLHRAAAAGGLGGLSFGVAELASAGAVNPPRRVAATPRRRPHTTSDVQLTALPGGAVVPTATWVKRENAQTGSTGWIVTGTQTPRSIEGFADVTSAVVGDDVHLFVNTTAPSFHVEAYR